jgi:hypothetical protein
MKLYQKDVMIGLLLENEKATIWGARAVCNPKERDACVVQLHASCQPFYNTKSTLGCRFSSATTRPENYYLSVQSLTSKVIGLSI